MIRPLSLRERQREVDASADRGRLPDVIAAVGEGHPEERGILEGACEAGGHGQRAAIGGAVAHLSRVMSPRSTRIPRANGTLERSHEQVERRGEPSLVGRAAKLGQFPRRAVEAASQCLAGVPLIIENRVGCTAILDNRRSGGRRERARGCARGD